MLSFVNIGRLSTCQNRTLKHDETIHLSHHWKVQNLTSNAQLADLLNYRQRLESPQLVGILLHTAHESRIFGHLREDFFESIKGVIFGHRKETLCNSMRTG